MAKKRRTASQVGKLSRAKGKTFEQEVARALRGIYGEGVKRGWQARDGDDAPDVDGTPFWVEAKRGRRVNYQAALVQVMEARESATKKKDPRAVLPPLVVGRDDNGEALALLRFEDLVKLLRTFHEVSAPPSQTVTVPIEVSELTFAQPPQEKESA